MTQAIPADSRAHLRVGDEVPDVGALTYHADPAINAAASESPTTPRQLVRPA